LIVWGALRFLEKTPVVFNRAYMASLIWALIAVLTGGLVIAAPHGQAARSVFVLPGMRTSLVLDMLVGAYLIGGLVPRIDARRVKPTSACMAVALVMVVAMVIGTTIR